MGSLNKVILLGNLGADPEVRYTANGRAAANFNIATTEVWNDKNSGDRQERTEWHRIVCWGKTAELAKEYLKKGRTVLIEGRLQTREWEDKEGKKRWTTEVVADRVTFVGRPEGGGGGSYDRGERGSYDRGDRGDRGGGGGYDRGRAQEPRASEPRASEPRAQDSGSPSADSHDSPPPLDDDDIPF
ncbi:MAG: single-stranded DNA-binding protein [Deltaproteobacteria bacterium]|nr:single-stranded DNA-binding protein [Deltaproteobacteria bacterium]